MALIIGLLVIVLLVVMIASVGLTILAIAAAAFGTYFAFIIGGFVGAALFSHSDGQAGFFLGSVVAVILLWAVILHCSNLKDRTPN